jgi:DNA adenine methylase
MRALKSVGSKYRVMPHIRAALHETGGDFLIDVFGGSGSVVMNANFHKNVYNDLDGDLVNFFTVLRDDVDRPRLLRLLRNLPMSRAEFERLTLLYNAGGRSFVQLDRVARAAATFYRSNYSYGGKMSTGGFSCSASDRTFIKEAKTYQSRLRQLAQVAEFWKTVCIENLSYQAVIENYGRRKNAVLYCDPPYFGTEGYYSRTIGPADHVFLAEQVNSCAASVVVSYYDFKGIRELYPPDVWEYRTFTATKNSLSSGARKETMTELLLIRSNQCPSTP